MRQLPVMGEKQQETVELPPLVELSAAVRRYVERTQPEQFLTDWALVTHKMSAEMDAKNTTAVGMVLSEGTNFVVGRGLLEHALDIIKRD